MNKGTSRAGAELAKSLLEAIEGGAAGDPTAVDIVVCPPYTAIYAVRETLGVASGVAIGAQDAFWKASGAYTSQISPEMLATEGVTFVILGHSETRGRFGVPEPDFTDEVLKVFGETDVTVNRKTKAALSAGLTPIVCIGETRSEREAGDTDSVVGMQVRGALADISAEQAGGIVFAYEPVWAIGTGLTCEPDEADRVCGVVRSSVEALYGAPTAESVRIQYGGSMKPDNAAYLLARRHIDGGLIGGASLKAADFAAIIAAAAAAR
jgi:triosephosphate isomerase